ncbi:RNA recognition motif domain-containing protein [Ditylenchus destructor]|nr:RNA recognition motif domain-containing protein [Ditylenchus destructor]
MVKLFVGNLSNTVDSHRLRNLFLQYVQVQECDVVPNKNFAFVHVTTEQDADEVIDKLEKHQLDGREIHIERSTSRLRREPGMSSKCFTCGAEDHKTTMCPHEPKNGTGTKRSMETEHEAVKRPKTASTYQPTIINSSISSSNSPTYFSAPSSLVEKDDDPELPRPQNPELEQLYIQYREARLKYFFFRERLSKELKIQPEAVNTTAAPLQSSAPIHLGRVNLTSLVNRQSPASSIRTNTSGSASPFPATSTVQPSNPTYSALPITNTNSGANSTTLFTSNAYNVTTATAPALQQCAPSTLLSGTGQSQSSSTRIPSLASITSRNPVSTSFTHMSGHASSTPNGGANRR